MIMRIFGIELSRKPVPVDNIQDSVIEYLMDTDEGFCSLINVQRKVREFMGDEYDEPFEGLVMLEQKKIEP